MQRTYRTLAVMAVIAMVVGIFEPSLLYGYLPELLLHLTSQGPYAPMGPALFWRIAVQVLPTAMNALIIATMTVAVVIAAWTHRSGWLAALAIFGALIVLSPILVALPLVIASERLNIYMAAFPFGLFSVQAAPAVLGCALALVFALTGLRRADAVAAQA